MTQSAAAAPVEAEITVSETVTFPNGIPGFESCRRWIVLSAEGHTPLRRLHAVDGIEASFLALDPRQVLEGYRCDLSDSDRARIGADDMSAVQLAIGSSGVPETFVIDGKGVIRHQHIGDIRVEDIPELMEKLREAGA